MQDDIPAVRLDRYRWWINGEIVPDISGAADAPLPPAPPTAAEIDAMIEAKTKAIVAEVLAKLPKPAAPTAPVQAADARPVGPDPKLAAVLDAFGAADAEELIAAAGKLRAPFEKVRPSVADPAMRALMLKSEMNEKRLAAVEAERVQERRTAAWDRSLTAAIGAARKLPLRPDVAADKLVYLVRADGLLGAGDDGALFAANGDGRTPSGATVEETLATFVEKNPWLKAPPTAGGPRVTAGAPNTAPPEPRTFTTEELATPEGARAWFDDWRRNDPAAQAAVKSLQRPADA